MLARGGIFGLLLLALWLWALYDVITTPKGTERNLPKVAWVFIVFLFFALGSLAWLVLGRPYPETRAAADPAGMRPRRRRHPSDSRDDAASMSDRERQEIERRDYYRRMDEELDRRLEEKRRRDLGLSDEGA